MKNNFDVIIIGSGISGLVAGCYLERSGIKTAIFEQHSRPGGYCSSFKRGAYNFDSSIHYIGGIKRGALSGILKELDENQELEFSQFDPSDRIITSETQFDIRANPIETINELGKVWPKEGKSAEKFYKFITQDSVAKIFREVENKTFQDILDLFFQDKYLKLSFSILFLGNMGLPPSQISAFTGVVFFREFLLDPGYYPKGGAQAFSDFLARKFKDSGGKLFLSSKVKEILIDKDNTACGIVASENEIMKARFIVSSIDATQTFCDLIKINNPERSRAKKLVPSNSIFAIYLGFEGDISKFNIGSSNYWICDEEDVDSYYLNLRQNIKQGNIKISLITFPSNKEKEKRNLHFSAQLFTPAIFETKEFWNENKGKISEKLLKHLSFVSPDLRNNAKIIITATPHTFYRYTLNRGGAAFGWASTKEQVKTELLPQVTSVKNLFLAGHWTIMGAGQGGISTVALSGKKAAERILSHMVTTK